jgi:4-aminobutyrate aminotransferase/(S)-3-amino-2-methylpropionate transaminase
VSDESFRARSEAVGAAMWGRLARIAAASPAVGEVRGLGPMLAIELVEQTPDLAKATLDAARERGLVLLSCGGYGNVIRLLAPLTISDDDLEQGLDILEEALADASGRAR